MSSNLDRSGDDFTNQRSSSGQPLPKYLTPADVRAIPNEQWEAWIKAGHIPWEDFRISVDVREVAFEIGKATIRRVEAEKRAAKGSSW